ncbi:MAG: hypothetical protein JWP63_1864 [Candidatus Solibacter sp.]|nr:hypothetical protein [Candidatus Solibacter sp.]
MARGALVRPRRPLQAIGAIENAGREEHLRSGDYDEVLVLRLRSAGIGVDALDGKVAGDSGGLEHVARLLGALRLGRAWRGIELARRANRADRLE